jgi:hypothetical protein
VFGSPSVIPSRLMRMWIVHPKWLIMNRTGMFVLVTPATHGSGRLKTVGALLTLKFASVAGGIAADFESPARRQMWNCSQIFLLNRFSLSMIRRIRSPEVCPTTISSEHVDSAKVGMQCADAASIPPMTKSQPSSDDARTLRWSISGTWPGKVSSMLTGC